MATVAAEPLDYGDFKRWRNEVFFAYEFSFAGMLLDRRFPKIDELDIPADAQEKLRELLAEYAELHQQNLHQFSALNDAGLLSHAKEREKIQEDRIQALAALDRKIEKLFFDVANAKVLERIAKIQAKSPSYCSFSPLADELELTAEQRENLHKLVIDNYRAQHERAIEARQSGKILSRDERVKRATAGLKSYFVNRFSVLKIPQIERKVNLIYGLPKHTSLTNALKQMNEKDRRLYLQVGVIRQLWEAENR